MHVYFFKLNFVIFFIHKIKVQTITKWLKRSIRDRETVFKYRTQNLVHDNSS